MTSVVLRCPNCGTTQSTPGECEACHDATVRAYCPNHEPGLWVDGRTCPSCEARARATSAPPPRSTSAKLDISPAGPARGEEPASGVMVPRRTSPIVIAGREPVPASLGQVGGLVARAVVRLALLVAVVIAMVAGAVYVLVR